MKRMIRTGLSLALGFFATRTYAQDVEWRAKAPPLSGATSTSEVRVVTLSQPSTGVGFDSQVRPVSLFSPVVSRGKIDDNARPLPVGMRTGDGPVGPTLITDGPPAEFTAPAPTPINPIMPYTPGMPVTQGMPMQSMHVSRPGMFFNADDCGCGAPVADTCSTCTGTMGLCDSCGARPRFWVSGEYLGWRLKNYSVPPLITMSSGTTPVNVPGPGSTTVPIAGVLGQPTTTVVYDRVPEDFRSGGRITLGFWFPRHDEWGVEASYFSLLQQNTHFQVGDNGGAGSSIFARPFFNTSTGAEDVQLVSVPGALAGTVGVDTFSRLWGLEFNLRRKLWCDQQSFVDLLVGYRHLDLDERLSITENLFALDPGGAVTTNFRINEQFATQNIFNGAQVGLAGEYHFAERWFLGGNMKVAGGNMHQVVTISGSTTTIPTGGAGTTVNGGLLTASSNTGKNAVDRFAVVPEGGLKVGYELTENLRLWVGYDFLYASSVVRPGEQIDRASNPNLQFGGNGSGVGPNRPAVLFKTSDFWAQGVNAGLEYRF